MSIAETVADLVDGALELTVVPSFTRIGPAVRSRVDHWEDPLPGCLRESTVVITGTTSGIGAAAAERLLGLGATLVTVGRSQDRLDRSRSDLLRRHPTGEVIPVVADLGELDQVDRAAADIRARADGIHALIHNAGALLAQRTLTTQGHESTVASQVLGPFLLTARLSTRLAQANGRVITMASGGMYTATLDPDRLEMEPGEYRGAEQYARAKRAQVTLNELWAERVQPTDIVFHAAHPGWARTPGLDEALPHFARVLGPLLRDADAGADILCWLATSREAGETSGLFWLDRRPRPVHRLRRTRASDTPERRRALWEWCVEQTGVDPGVELPGFLSG